MAMNWTTSMPQDFGDQYSMSRYWTKKNDLEVI